jgi:hypothetical protein
VTENQLHALRAWLATVAREVDGEVTITLSATEGDPRTVLSRPDGITLTRRGDGALLDCAAAAARGVLPPGSAN